MNGSTDCRGAIIDDGQACAGRHRAPQPRQLGVNALHSLDHIGAWLSLDIDDDGRLPPVPGADFGVLKPVDYVSDVADLDRGSVTERYDNVLVNLDGRYLVVCRDGVGLMRAIERALRSGNVGADDGRAQIL